VTGRVRGCRSYCTRCTSCRCIYIYIYIRNSEQSVPSKITAVDSNNNALKYAYLLRTISDRSFGFRSRFSTGRAAYFLFRLRDASTEQRRWIRIAFELRRKKWSKFNDKHANKTRDDSYVKIVKLFGTTISLVTTLSRYTVYACRRARAKNCLSGGTHSGKSARGRRPFRIAFYYRLSFRQ